MDVSEAKQLKSLEDENVRLKKLLADADAGAAGAARVPVKKGQGPLRSSLRRLRRLRRLVLRARSVAHLQATMGLSERRACTIIGADRTTSATDPGGLPSWN